MSVKDGEGTAGISGVGQVLRRDSGLLPLLDRLGVKVHLGEEVEDLLAEDGRCAGIRLKKGGRQERLTE